MPPLDRAHRYGIDAMQLWLVGVEVVIVAALLPWLVASWWSWVLIPGLINMVIVGHHGVGTVAGDARYCALLAHHGHCHGIDNGRAQ